MIIIIIIFDSNKRNASVKKVKKLSKDKDLEMEISRMWGLEKDTVPVVIGAFGPVKKVWENTLKPAGPPG